MKKRLSVVVPMYNVDLFLVDALDTLLEQDLSSQELQVILVDDGSTDKTGEIARRYVKKHPEIFEYYLFENGGLGASRNRGTKLANSEYITYSDPDDKIVPGSYRKALNILQDTHSDILIGGTKRFNSKRIWNSWIHSKAEIKNLRNIKFSDHPELVWDSTAWNKLYRLDFIRQNKLFTPENILYEDMPMVVPALTLAKSIDVMTSTMYMWRSRDFGAPSITQMASNETKPLIDRLFAMTSIIKDLKRYDASEKIFNAQLDKFLNFDIMVMYAKDKFNLFSKSQKQEIFHALRKFLQLFSDEQLDRANFHDLVYFKEVLKSSSVERFSQLTLDFLRENTNYVGYWDNESYKLTSNISNFSKDVTVNDFKLHPKVEKVTFLDNKLVVNGFFFAEFADMSKKEFIKNAKVSLLDDDQDILQSDVGNITFKYNHMITATYGYNKNHFSKDGADFNYDFAKYEFILPLNDIKVDVKNLSFMLSVEIDGVQVKEFIKNPVSGYKPRPNTYISDYDNAYSLVYDANSWNMQLKIHKNVAVLRSNSKNQLIYNDSQDNLYIEYKDTLEKIKVFQNKVYFPLKIQNLLKTYSRDARHLWRFVKISANTGLTEDVYYASEPIHYENDSSLQVTFANSDGIAVHKVTWVYPVINSININNVSLELVFKLSGWLNEASVVEILGDPKVPELVWSTQKISDNLYYLNLPLTKNNFGNKEWLNFHVRLMFADGYHTDELLRWGPDNFEVKNNWFTAGDIGWLIWDVSRYEFGGFALKRTDNRVYRQRQIGEYETFLENDYQQWLKEPLLDKTVVWSSYWGKGNKLESNPGALYQYFKDVHPEYNNVIVLSDVISDYNDIFPGAKVVSFNTKEYWYYLAKSKYFVNDVNFEESARVKRPGQVEIQTMHGTPLKKMGFDVLSDWSDKTYNNYLRKNKNWDYLVVPSDYVAEISMKAYGVQPKLLKTGYPRNDLLLAAKDNINLFSLRQKLNIPTDKKIILYAPTWRTKGQTDINSYIDVQSLYDNMPDDMVILIRSHTYEKWVGLKGKFQDKIQYASQDTSIEDLYLASDAVITDYSSVMFDYALLDKPMMFFAFDYNKYVQERGLNIDLKSIAPGPFIEQQNELEKWLNKFELIDNEYATRISKFKRKFSQFDIGDASKKIVKDIWG